MKYILAILAVLIALPASAQTILPGDTKVAITFYVKEGTASPYQGLLTMTQQEYAKLKPADIQKLQLDQHVAWKVATEAARSVVVKEPTADEKADEAKALQAQADEIAVRIDALKADPEVAAKLEAKR
jgi:hypothetical protein